jgi:hypothetical protein
VKVGHLFVARVWRRDIHEFVRSLHSLSFRTESFWTKATGVARS